VQAQDPNVLASSLLGNLDLLRGNALSEKILRRLSRRDPHIVDERVVNLCCAGNSPCQFFKCMAEDSGLSGSHP
jgi:hypothetical protein